MPSEFTPYRLKIVMPPRTTRVACLLASAAIMTVLALPLAGCKTTGDDTTGSISASETPRTEAEWRQSLEVWGDRYKKDPGDAQAAMAYARALRATEQRSQAVAVLEQSAMRNPRNMPLLGEYGRALAAAGQYPQALDALGRANTPDNPDWRILNAEGAVLDQMGRHVEAQRIYSTALKIVPDEPSVLSNLGLSYALTRDLKRAETTLRRALAQRDVNPKVRQNLALIVGLQGRFAEADDIARQGLPSDEAEANVNYLRQMLAQQKQAKHGGGLTMPPPNPGG